MENQAMITVIFNKFMALTVSGSQIDNAIKDIHHLTQQDSEGSLEIYMVTYSICVVL